jgi:hypothetical protein
MPKDFHGFTDEPNIQASQAAGGKKFKQSGSDFTGKSESQIVRSEADGKSKGKGGPPKAKPDSYRG